MTLADLKQRATASELTLIEATEKAVKDASTKSTSMLVVEFMRANPMPDWGMAPTREAAEHQRVGWFKRMEQYLQSRGHE